MTLGNMRSRSIDPGILDTTRIRVAAENDDSRDLCLEAQLEDLDLPYGKIEAVVKITQRAAEVLSFHRTAEAIRWIAERLGGNGTAGAALASVLGLSDDTPMAEFASRFGVSKQAIGNRVADLRPLFPETTAKHTHDDSRPTEPGDWISRTEAQQITKIRGDRLTALAKQYGIREARAGQRVFWERAEILKAAELNKQFSEMRKYIPKTE